jgi:hypothetical protein
MAKRKAVIAALAPLATFFCAALGVVLFLPAAQPATIFQLITPEEAALPPGKIPTFEVRGSPTRLPNITVVSPPPRGGAVYSPLDFKLSFRAYGGAAIDPSSVVVTYIKNPDIDITPRLRLFITAAGIDIPQAEAPPGRHEFWIEVTDTDGRSSAREFDFQVLK